MCEREFCLRHCNRKNRRACDRICGRTKCEKSQAYQYYKLAQGLAKAVVMLDDTMDEVGEEAKQRAAEIIKAGWK